MLREETTGCRAIYLEETVAHLGGRGLYGALVYTGTRRVQHTERRLRLYVNGKPGYTYYITITVSAADLYDVEMWSVRGNSKQCLGQQCDLYFDDLQTAVERLYDEAMNATNDGCIPLR